MPTDAPAIIPELLTLGQAAAMCSMGNRTLWRHSHNGLAPRPVKIGGLMRYRRMDLLAWIESCCKPCDTQDGGAGEARP
jgi:predicted DNA-binding transcriptional regulator AlpA